MDIRSRTKVAFVVERYALDEVGESGRRTRAMAAAMSARGHDVTVLTTCARDPDRWENACAAGKSSVDGISVVRFRLADGQAWWRRQTKQLALRHPKLARIGRVSVDHACVGYGRYLDHLGYLFDAVFFSGSWGPMAMNGVSRVRNAVLCPPPMDEPTHGMKSRARVLFRASRAVAVATAEEMRRLRDETGCSWSCPTYMIGAAPDPTSEMTYRMKRMRIVDGPYLLHIGHSGPATAQMLEAFRFLREAHADTPLEDDQGERMLVRDVRLVLVGDWRFPHAPEEGVLCLGPVDEAVRTVLVHRALAVVHADPSNRLPMSLLSAWAQGRPTLIRGDVGSLAPVLDRTGAEYVYESPSTFAASAASLLSSRGPRRAFGARASELCRRSFSPLKLSDGLEKCVRGVLGRAKGQVVPFDASV